MKALLTTILILLCCFAGWEVFQAVQNPTYEYTVGHVRDQTLKSELNALGALGWKVVSARRALVNEEPRYEFIMMREIR